MRDVLITIFAEFLHSQNYQIPYFQKYRNSQNNRNMQVLKFCKYLALQFFIFLG